MGCGPSRVSLRDWGSVHVLGPADLEGAFLPEDWDGEPWVDVDAMESACSTEDKRLNIEVVHLV